MKKAFIIFVLSCIVFQSLSKLIILAKFEVQRDYIAKNLCVKKEEVNNCCQGNCHLQKQLSEDDKNQDQQKTIFKGKYTDNHFLNKFVFIIHLDEKPVSKFDNYKTQKTISYPANIFHPPPFSPFI